MKSTVSDTPTSSRSCPPALSGVSQSQLDRSPSPEVLNAVGEAADRSPPSIPDRVRGPKRRRIEMSSSEPEDGDNEATSPRRPIALSHTGRGASWTNIRPLEDAIASLMSDDVVPDSEPDDDFCNQPSPKKNGTLAKRIVY